MIIEIGVAGAKVLAKYEAAVQNARALLAVQEEKRAIAAEGVLAGIEVPGPITSIDEVAGTITVEDVSDAAKEN